MTTHTIKPTVLLDCDGVLADFAGALLSWAGPAFSRSQLTETDLIQSLGLEHRQEEFDAVASEPGFCESLPILEGAQDFVESLRSFTSEIIVVTSPYSAAKLWTFERLRWLEKHFAITKHDVIFAKRKELIRGDILIDDFPKNVKPFAERGGHALLIDQPWNASFQTQASDFGRIERCGSLEHALESVRSWW